MSRILHSLAALAALLFAAALPAQDEARLLAAFDKTFTPPPKGKATVEEKVAALQTLRDVDSGKVAETLVGGWLGIAAELAQIDADRDAKNQEVAEIQKGQEASDHRTFETKKLERHNQLRDELAALRRRGDELRDLQEKIAQRIASLHRRDSALWLLKNVTGQKKYGVALKLAAAKSIGGNAAEVLEDLAAALTRAREPEELIVLVDAFGAAGKAAQPHATPVIALLDSKEDAVAERAAQALAKIAVADAVPGMIALLARSSGQTRQRVAAALEILTSEQFGTNVGSWQAWWQAEGAKLPASGRQLGVGKPSKRSDGGTQTGYYGIPQDQSHSILYVIDCSGSMKAPVKWQGRAGTATEKSIVDTTRIEACKFELVRALGLLRPNQRFAILWYNDMPHFWEPKMQEASKETIERAQAFVKGLQPASSTNIHDSLEQCFKLVGRGAHDKHYGIDLDTIFLMTDGSPTTHDGKLDSTDKILAGVRSWNALKRVTIHCIAMGKDLNEQFLRQLADENGGEFKQF